MKAWAAGAAILGLAACIENPGVDEGLATRHDRTAATADLAGKFPLRVRLERKAGVTRMFLSNPGGSRFDSLAYLIQLSHSETPSPWPVPVYRVPYFGEDPFFEARGTLPGLEAGAETELGTVREELPRELGRLHIRFIPIHAKGIGNPGGNAYDGYYRGAFVTRSPSGPGDSGIARGVISDWGYFFWLKREGRGASPLRGWIYGDSIQDAVYRETWKWAGRRSGPGSAIQTVPESDSIRFRIDLRGEGSAPEDTSLTLEIALLRAPQSRRYYGNSGDRDDPYSPDDTAAVAPSP